MNDQSDAVQSENRRSRTVLVTFLGAIVRRMGNWMPIAGTVELLTEAGHDASSIRTGVSRLKKKEWLSPQARSGVRGYELTGTALEGLAAGDEIIWHARRPMDLADGWCAVSFSVPESARSQRHQLRAHLTSLGFGNIGSALWIAPARMERAAEQVIAELGMTAQCAILVGHYVAGQDLKSLVGQSWDLDVIDARYARFVEEYAPILAELRLAPAIDSAEAFATYLSVVDQWRKLPYRDPGLAAELLPPDWSAPRAVTTFEQLVSLLDGRALAHAGRHWNAS